MNILHVKDFTQQKKKKNYKTSRPPTEWEYAFANEMMVIGLILKI